MSVTSNIAAIIRPGGGEDIPELMGLIRELAEFARSAHRVNNSEEQLFEDWCVHRAFDFLVAEVDGRVVGMSLFYPCYSSWSRRCYHLDDLYVMPAFRGRKIGTQLLEATAEFARSAGATRLDWQVLDWNADAVRFYEKIGAAIERGWWNCKWDFAISTNLSDASTHEKLA